MATMARWTPAPDEDYAALKGREVVTADGEPVGSIEAVLHPLVDRPGEAGGHLFLVMPGLLQSLVGTDAFYFPEAAIAAVDADRVTLTVPTEGLATQGWTDRPNESDVGGRR